MQKRVDQALEKHSLLGQRISDGVLKIMLLGSSVVQNSL